MGKAAANIRRALEAEGWTEEEIQDALREHALAEPDRGDPAERAGIPKLYADLSWDVIEEEAGNLEALQSAREWAGGRGEDKGLYVWSDGYGNSKTMIAAAAALERLRAGQMIRWLDMSRLLNDLNLSFNNPQYERAASHLTPPEPGEVIILDDIDKIPATDRNVQPVFVLVHDCVNAEAPLIITANRHLDSLAKDFGHRFGRAMASRVVGHCLDVEVTGRDRRVEP